MEVLGSKRKTGKYTNVSGSVLPRPSAVMPRYGATDERI
jgi:hypothetical protein